MHAVQGGLDGPEMQGPVHRAEHLLLGRRVARILLGDRIYVLRLTEAGELALGEGGAPGKSDENG